MMHLRAVVLGTILVLAGSPVCFAQAAEGSFERMLRVSGELTLDVATGSGRIDVHTGASDTVMIRGRIRATDAWFATKSPAERVRQVEDNPPIEQDGNSIRVGRVGDHEGYNNVSISYDITVPAATRLRASAGSGAIRADGIKGPARVTTGSGSIELGGIAGAMEARAGSGRILVHGLGAGIIARAGSGSVTLDLAQTAAFDLSATTGSGGIQVDHPMTMQGQSNRHRIDASVRGGGPLVDVSTGSGPVRIN
jgi:putative adhesin